MSKYYYAYKTITGSSWINGNEEKPPNFRDWAVFISTCIAVALLIAEILCYLTTGTHFWVKPS